MNLYFLRHGQAVDRDTPGCRRDADRPLTPKGRQRLRRTAGAMEAMELHLEAILSSPYRRARQTAEIVARALNLQDRLSFSRQLTPAGSPQALIAELNRLNLHNLLLVGHEPGLGNLIARLVTGGRNLELELKKGGLCKLEAGPLRHGRCATLAWLLTPKQLELMA
jgi:phosphohistidine phosphatase